MKTALISKNLSTYHSLRCLIMTQKWFIIRSVAFKRYVQSRILISFSVGTFRAVSTIWTICFRVKRAFNKLLQRLETIPHLGIQLAIDAFKNDFFFSKIIQILFNSLKQIVVISWFLIEKIGQQLISWIINNWDVGIRFGWFLFFLLLKLNLLRLKESQVF
jgi:hypothetical protein